MTTLKQRVLSYFQRNPTLLVASGEIQRMVQQKTVYTPANATRRLRELAEEGLLTVKLIKGHAHYKLAPQSLPEANPEVLQLSLSKVINQMDKYWNSIPE